MRLPRVRFTVRRLMVAVAIIGPVTAGRLWCGKMYGRSRNYMDLSNYYETRVDFPTAAPVSVSQEAWLRAWRRDRDLMVKYRRLAFNPWLPVAPDPPEPE